MASIIKELDIPAPADQVWDALADFYAVHERVAPGFLTGLERDEAAGARIVSFSNGSVAREVLVSSDHERMRLVYTIPSERMTAHSASVHVAPEGPGACRVTWITDVLPDEIATYIDGQMTLGAAAMTRALSGGLD